MMGNSEKVRQFLTAHPDSTNARIAEGTGLSRKVVSCSVCERLKAGEFTRNEAGEVRLNPNYAPSTQLNRLPKKVRGFRAEKRARKAARGSKLKSVADVARKHAGGVCVAPSPAQVHVRTTFTVLEAVIDLDGAEPMLQAAFRAHKEALEIAGA
jgi:hypothetical protein